jgi:hypothetical protein
MQGVGLFLIFYPMPDECLMTRTVEKLFVSLLVTKMLGSYYYLESPNFFNFVFSRKILEKTITPDGGV